MDLQFAMINGRKVIALPFFLEALQKADADLKAQGIGYGTHPGLVVAGEETCSWRSLALQKQLVAKGASKTLYSNHRRGTACDVVADWAYIGKIAPTMKKYGLVNDLAYAKYVNGVITAVSATKLAGYVGWDGGHFNWQSNLKAGESPIVDVAPVILKEFSMHPYEGKIVQMSEGGYEGLSGAFAYIDGGKKRIIQDKSRGWKALATINVIRDKTGLTKAAWDAIPTGNDF